MKNRIVFIVATQYDNVGDLLINKCLINELSLHGEVYLDLKNVPSSFRQLLLSETKNVYDFSAISSYSFKGLKGLLLLFNNPSITHIFKSPGPFGSGGNKRVFLKNMLIGLIFMLFRFRGIQSSLVGNDIHSKNTLDKLAVKYFSRNTNKLLCRSYNNVSGLRNLGLKNVEYIPDMCFGFSPAEVSAEKENHIGVSFRRLDDSLYHDNIVETIRTIFEVNKGIKITFFYQVQHDFSYNKELFELFKDRENVYFKANCLDWNELSFYNPFEFTFSNRLHVLLLGLVHGAIPLAFLNFDAKTQKIIDIFEGVNLNNLLFHHKISENGINNIFSSKNDLRFQIKEINLIQKKLIHNEIASLFQN